MSNLSDKDLDRLAREAADRFQPNDDMLSWSRLESKLVHDIPHKPPALRGVTRLRPLLYGSAVVLISTASYLFIQHQAHKKNSTLPDSLTSTSPAATFRGEPSNSAASDAAGRAGTSDAATQSSNATAHADASDEVMHSDASRAAATRTNTSGASDASNALGAATRADASDAANASGAMKQAVASDAEKHTAATGRRFATDAAAQAAERGASKTGGEDNGNLAGNDFSASGAANRDITNAARHAEAAASSAGIPARYEHHQLVARGHSGQAIPAKFSSEEHADSQAAGKNEDAGTTNASATGKATSSVKPAMPAYTPCLAGLASPARIIRVGGNDSLLRRFAAASPTATAGSRTMEVRRPLTIGIVVGPDYSTVKGLSSDQFSNNVGLSLGLHLTGRLSINTGIQYSRKYYWSRGQDFHMPPIGSWAPIRTDFVNGDCSMFEIPLNLRYDFPAGKKSILFVSAGASSYLLQREIYTYYFHSFGRPYDLTVEPRHSPSSILSIGALSAGVERDLGNGLSFQAEPFLRIPFSGIGFGQVQLNSYGILLSLRYAPALGRARR